MNGVPSSPSDLRTVRSAMRMRLLALAAIGGLVFAACSATVSEDPAEVVLTRFHEAITAGDVAAAIDLLAEDAVWALGNAQFRLDRPFHDQYLLELFGVEPDATGLDTVRAYTEYLVASRSVPVASDCIGDEEAVRCVYVSENGFTPLVGSGVYGTVAAATENGQLTRYALVIISFQDKPGPEGIDGFRRWSAIRDPATLRAPFIQAASDSERMLEAYDALHDEWEAAGRPDIEPAVVLDDPIEVAEAWFAANNAGDWETQVSFTGGEALSNPTASRDQFEAARLIEREVTLDSCSVTFETADEVRIACGVTVNDIITAAVGEAATNSTQTSIAVRDGRVVGGSLSLPSHGPAQREIGRWAQREVPDNYQRACPFGVFFPISEVCARFIATYHGQWAAPIAEFGLASSG